MQKLSRSTSTCAFKSAPVSPSIATVAVSAWFHQAFLDFRNLKHYSSERAAKSGENDFSHVLVLDVETQEMDVRPQPTSALKTTGKFNLI